MVVLVLSKEEWGPKKGQSDVTKISWLKGHPENGHVGWA